jgi:probable phosphoglycerate mutase
MRCTGGDSVWRVADQMWVVRHGATQWSVAGRHTGTTDLPLTEQGRQQAETIRPVLGRARFARVLSSPLQRARETARLCGFDHPAIDADLAEWDYGTYEGRTTADIRGERPGWSLWHDGCPDGESAADVGRRCDAVLSRLRDVDGVVLVVAHGHLLRVLAARWLALAPEQGALLALETATIGVLGHEREQAVVRRWNWTPEPPTT